MNNAVVQPIGWSRAQCCIPRHNTADLKKTFQISRSCWTLSTCSRSRHANRAGSVQMHRAGSVHDERIGQTLDRQQQLSTNRSRRRQGIPWVCLGIHSQWRQPEHQQASIWLASNRLNIVSKDTHDRWKYSENDNGVKGDIPADGAADQLDRPDHSAAPCSAGWSLHLPVPPGFSPWNFFSSD